MRSSDGLNRLINADHVTDLADDAVNLHAIELAASGVLERTDRVLKQILKRSGSTRSSAECLEWRSGRANLRVVDVGNLPGVQQAKQLVEGRSPSDLRIANDNGRVGLVELLGNHGKLSNALTLDGVTDSGTTAQNVEDFSEHAYIVDSHIGTVVRCHVVALKSRACGHQCTHRWQDFLVQDRAAKFLNLTLSEAATKLVRLTGDLIDVAVYGLFPCLPASLIVVPSSVLALVDILLIEGG
jgi:hypothetical protein